MSGVIEKATDWVQKELGSNIAGSLGQDLFMGGMVGKGLIPALSAGATALGVGEMIPGVNVIMDGALVAGGLATVLYGAFHKEKMPTQPKLPDPIKVGSQFGA
tara:strand:- start:6687 stop:6995 length:309 start_codon:yes stop_codon:yes gene_type:complete